MGEVGDVISDISISDASIQIIKRGRRRMRKVWKRKTEERVLPAAVPAINVRENVRDEETKDRVSNLKQSQSTRRGAGMEKRCVGKEREKDRGEGHTFSCVRHNQPVQFSCDFQQHQLALLLIYLLQPQTYGYFWTCCRATHCLQNT